MTDNDVTDGHATYTISVFTDQGHGKEIHPMSGTFAYGAATATLARLAMLISDPISTVVSVSIERT